MNKWSQGLIDLSNSLKTNRNKIRRWWGCHRRMTKTPTSIYSHKRNASLQQERGEMTTMVREIELVYAYNKLKCYPTYLVRNN